MRIKGIRRTDQIPHQSVVKGEFGLKHANIRTNVFCALRSTSSVKTLHTHIGNQRESEGINTTYLSLIFLGMRIINSQTYFKGETPVSQRRIVFISCKISDKRKTNRNILQAIDVHNLSARLVNRYLLPSGITK